MPSSELSDAASCCVGGCAACASSGLLRCLPISGAELALGLMQL